MSSRVAAEVPGVNKEDLRLRADENSLTIESVTGQATLSQTVVLPEKVDSTTAKSNYKNGILEVSLAQEQECQGGVPINIE